MHTPLQHIRVLDLTNVLAGPFCGHQLAHLGADVIKIEVPQSGDLARQLGADPALNQRHMGVSFLAQNSGKRSITVNLKNESGKQVLKDLVRTADVLLENFRPHVMDRLGLGYESLKAVNPDLVYCAISGFGQSGPLHRYPAYDHVVQGLAGVMSITGDTDSAPLRVGYPMADTIGGLTAAFAISAALTNRAKNGGSFIDVSMLDSVIATMGWVVSNFLVADKIPEPMGNQNFTASPSGTFQTGDGLLIIAANKQEQFEALCHATGCDELIEDPRFHERQARLDNRTELNRLLEQALATRSAEDWQKILNDRGVPAGCVLSVPDALAHPQVLHRELIGTFESPTGVDRNISLARTGMRLNGQAPRTESPPPELGAHTDEILCELGYTEPDIKALRKSGAI